MEITISASNQYDYYRTILNKNIKNEPQDIDLSPYFEHGILTDFANEAEYHKFFGLSQSELKNAKTSAYKYYFLKYVEPKDVDSKEADHGDLIHKSILEPHLLDKFITDDEICRDILVERPEVKNVRATSEFKAWAKEQAVKQKIIISSEKKKATEYMLERVYANVEARELLASPIKEKAILHYDDELGIFMRGKFDIISNSELSVVDVKKCQSVTDQEFGKTIWNWEYHIQIWYYLRMAQKKLNQGIKTFKWIGVESNAPYECQVFVAHNEMVTAGEYMVKHYLEKIQHGYLKRNFDYEKKRQRQIMLPKYAENVIDEILSNNKELDGHDTNARK